MWSRRRVVAGALAVGMVAGLAALAVIPFDADALGRAVLARAASATGVTLTARGFRLRALDGLALEGLEGEAAFSGGRATIAADRLVLDHRLWRLLVGELAVGRLVLQRPRIRLVEAPAERGGRRAPAPAAGAAASLGRLTVRLSRIDVEDGTVELQALGQPRPVVVSGLDLTLRDIAVAPGRAALAGLSGTGELRIQQVAFAKTRAANVRGALRVGGGRLQTGTVRFQTPQGPFEATLDAQLDRLPFAYTLSLVGEPLDVASMMGPGVPGGSGRGPGPGALRLDGRGVGAEATGLRGRGVLRLAAGELPATPLLRAVEGLLGRTRLVGAPYEAAEAPFRVEDGRVWLDDLRLRSAQVGLDVAGWASLDGPLRLTLAVHAPRAGLAVEGLTASALDALTDTQGRVVVPLEVTGTQERPRVRPDLAALAGQTRRGAARTLLEKAGRGLGGLLRGKEPPP